MEISSSKELSPSSRPLMHYSLNMLARRRYTVNDMRKKLSARSEKFNISSPEDIEKILERLKELKYLNDTEYAILFVEDQLRRSPQGSLMLKKRLKLKGLPTEEIDSALQNTGINDYEMARKALQKKQRSLVGQDPRKLSEKLFRFLLSRGFSPSISIKALEEIAGQTTLAG
jgi:regulatory protein